MLIPTVLSEYAPHFRRAVGAAPIVALLCGLGLAILLGQRRADQATRPDEVPARLREDGVSPAQIAAGMDRLRQLGRVIIVAVIMLGATVYTMTAYFGKWGNSQAIYYAYDQGLWEIGQYVLGLPADEAVYVTPRPATDMTLAFAWREGRPVRHFDGRHAFVAAAADRPTTYIVIEHEDFRGGQVLQSLYPDATETHTFRDRAGQVYARAYRVPPGSVAARQPKYPELGAVGQVSTWSGSIWIVLMVLTDRVTSSICSFGGVRQVNRARTGPSSRICWGRPSPTAAGCGPGSDAQPGQGSVPTTTWTPGDSDPGRVSASTAA